MGTPNSAIVTFYGLPLAGKTTSLRYLNAELNPAPQAETPGPTGTGPAVNQLSVHAGSATLYLRALSYPGAIVDGGYALYRPAQAHLVEEADALVVVLDGQLERADANQELVQDLRDTLDSRGLTLDSLPMVQQHNKSDLPNYRGGVELSAFLSLTDFAWFPTCAITGAGVLEVLNAITKRLVEAGRISLP